MERPDRFIVKAEFQIIGGGIIGLATAYELARRGKSVRVLEERNNIALATSFANAAMVHASLADPWNRPGVGLDILKAFFGLPSPMKLKLSTLPSLGVWGVDFLKNSNRPKHIAATRQIYALGQLSQQVYDVWREELKPDDDFTRKGLLKFFRTEKHFAAARAQGEILQKFGLKAQNLSAQQLVQKEPALKPVEDKIAGGIYYPEDYKADTYKFCLALAKAIKNMGGKIITNTKITGFISRSGRIIGVQGEGREYLAANTIIAAGPWSYDLARLVNIKLPIRPIKGYSLHFDNINQAGQLPKLPIVDDSLHCAITPLSGGLRIAGMAEICGLEGRLDDKTLQPIFNMFCSVYPNLAGGLDLASAKKWCGFRAVSCSGKPIIGKLKDGLFVNTGHAHMGWTLGAGSAVLLADILLGKTPLLAKSFLPNHKYLYQVRPEP